MKLGIKDKIFLGIVALGLFIFVYEKITGEKDDGDFRSGNKIVKEEIGAIPQGEDQRKQGFKEAEIIINGEKMIVWVADSEETRYRGLSDNDGLGDKAGMLFIHSEPGFYSYAMRQMKFDLDFIFILGEEIVDIQERIAAQDQGVLIEGALAYDKVLELPAGTVKECGILVGEKVEIVSLSK
jgi:uncharacterized membrane protein (UPF0127 family)